MSKVDPAYPGEDPTQPAPASYTDPSAPGPQAGEGPGTVRSSNRRSSLHSAEAPPAYTPRNAARENPPPSYESLFGKLKQANRETSSRAEFGKEAFKICCASFCAVFLLLLFFGLAIAHIVMGSIYMYDCPVEPLIPIYLVVSGCFSMVKSILQLVKHKRENSEDNIESDEEKQRHPLVMVIRLLDTFLSVWFIVGCVFVYRTNYQSDFPHLPGYCNGVVYQYAFWTITSSFILLGVILLLCIIFCIVICCIKSD